MGYCLYAGVSSSMVFPAPSARLIDNVPTVTPRPAEMQVLALGMSRTGTMSLQKALQKLGYKCYHMAETFRNPGSHKLWLEGVKAKYQGKGKPFGKPEFDKLLGNYSAVTDVPCIMFVDELLAAYPTAKVILTERDIDSWTVSIENTFLKVLSWTSFNYLAPLETKTIGPYWELVNVVISIWTDGNHSDRAKLRQTYRDHYAHFRSVVPKERRLEFKKEDGYERLCQFLNKPVPEGEDYPFLNQPDNIIEIHGRIWWRTFWNAVIKVGMGVGSLMAIALAVAWYWHEW